MLTFHCSVYQEISTVSRPIKEEIVVAADVPPEVEDSWFQPAIKIYIHAAQDNTCL